MTVRDAEGRGQGNGCELTKQCAGNPLSEGPIGVRAGGVRARIGWKGGCRLENWAFRPAAIFFKRPAHGGNFETAFLYIRRDVPLGVVPADFAGHFRSCSDTTGFRVGPGRRAIWRDRLVRGRQQPCSTKASPTGGFGCDAASRILSPRRWRSDALQLVLV